MFSEEGSGQAGSSDIPLEADVRKMRFAGDEVRINLTRLALRSGYSATPDSQSALEKFRWLTGYARGDVGGLSLLGLGLERILFVVELTGDKSLSKNEAPWSINIFHHAHDGELFEFDNFGSSKIQIRVPPYIVDDIVDFCRIHLDGVIQVRCFLNAPDDAKKSERCERGGPTPVKRLDALYQPLEGFITGLEFIANEVVNDPMVRRDRSREGSVEEPPKSIVEPSQAHDRVFWFMAVSALWCIAVSLLVIALHLWKR